MPEVYLSLGSSIGNRKKILYSAIDDLQKSVGAVLKISHIYETEPWGFEDINQFLNMAVLVNSDIDYSQLLQKIQEIEKKHKRVHSGTGYQARTLDIDIIFYDKVIYKSKELQIPHRLAHLRQFVLKPLEDISPELVHPEYNKTITQLLFECNDKLKITKVS